MGATLSTLNSGRMQGAVARYGAPENPTVWKAVEPGLNVGLVYSGTRPLSLTAVMNRPFWSWSRRRGWFNGTGFGFGRRHILF
jgi:hypothetical protein